jgi:spore maturation protein CgeB
MAPEIPPRPLSFAFFGSSLVSSYRNGACTYYRGIIRALHEQGHQVVFYEPDAFERQRHRDIVDPPWARVVVYPAKGSAARRAVAGARDADVVVQCSDVGVHDDEIAAAVLDLPGEPLRVFWDVEPLSTLAGLEQDPSAPLRGMIPEFDLVLTAGGGDSVLTRYAELGAGGCVPIYPALDPTTHYQVPHQAELAADLVFLGDRRPDREEQVEEFLWRVAALLPERYFLLGGSGWEDHPRTGNVRILGHVGTHRHNVVNSSPLAVLNLSGANSGGGSFSPAPRVFEAAGAAACVITDAVPGIERFLEPGLEILSVADGGELAERLVDLNRAVARAVGRAARRRSLREHTYRHRAEQLGAVLAERLARIGPPPAR